LGCPYSFGWAGLFFPLLSFSPSDGPFRFEGLIGLHGGGSGRAYGGSVGLHAQGFSWAISSFSPFFLVSLFF